MKTEIVKVWMCGGTDGYTHSFNDNRAVLTEAEAEAYTKPSGYCVSEPRWAVKIGNRYYLLEGGYADENQKPDPLTIGIDTQSEKERIKKQALEKLSRKEREILGIT